MTTTHIPEPDRSGEPPMPMSRRTLLRVAALAGAAGLVGPSLANASAAVAADFEAGAFGPWFADPANRYRAGFRWWWPHGLVDPVEIAREIDQIADAGFGMVEIADVHHSISATLDPDGHGWGTPAWRAAVEAALGRAAVRGIRVDMTIGPSWPPAVPTITPQDPRAAQEVVHGSVEVAAGSTYDGPVPAPVVAPSAGVTDKKLLLVQAARIVARPTNKPIGLDTASVTDITSAVQGDRITWTAPADGQWVVISYWQRGSGQRPEGSRHTTPDSYVVDHFSEAGAQTIFAFWDDAVLTPRIRELLRTTGGYVFEDSIEMETGATMWTDALLAEFRRLAGYDLTPYLPAVLEVKEKFVYDLDATTSARVRFDLGEVFGRLYLDHHLRPIQAWAKTLGLGLRVQPYGIENDAIADAAQLDIPEAESLGFKNLDDYRILASGRDIAGRSVLSCEAACYAGGAYNTTWQKALGTLGSIMAGGVSHHVLHGYSYRDAPGAAWPGFAAFSPYSGGPGYGEAWGPRMPSWRHVRPIADYLGRTQMLLQSGRPRVDVAVFRQRGWAATGIGAYYFTNDGIPVGWSHGFLSDGVMEVVPPVVKGGRLYPDGPAYKAVVIVGDPFAGRETTLPVESARRLAEMSRQGLPIVFSGDWTNARATGLATAEENAEVAGLVREIIARPTSRMVALDAQIPDALAALGVRREVEHATSTLMHIHRADDNVDYYYVANARHAENRKINRVEQDVVFTSSVRNAVPYVLDAWTGRAERVAVYRQDGDRFTFRLGLNPGENVVVAIGNRDWYDDEQGRGVSAVSTEADSVRFDGPRLVARTTRAGTYRTALVNGRTVTQRFDAAPDAFRLDGWTLEVEDWKPGSEPWQTDISTKMVELSALAPWTAIPGLEDVSGIGRYTTRFDVPAGWSAEMGAYLDLGAVFDTVKVTLNGEVLAPVTPLTTRIDLGKRLRAGGNTLVVETSTTLFNRLRTTNAAVFGKSGRQSYGLTGPVTVTPYREAYVK